LPGPWARDERNGDEPRPLDSDERAELERLRAENRELKMAVEFSKKVAAWFANDQR